MAHASEDECLLTSALVLTRRVSLPAMDLQIGDVLYPGSLGSDSVVLSVTTLPSNERDAGLTCLYVFAAH